MAEILTAEHPSGARALALGALLPLPLAWAAGLASRSWTLAGGVAFLSWLSWVRPEALWLLIVATAPVLRSMNAQRLPPELLAQAKLVAVFVLGGAWFLREAPRHRLAPWPGALRLAAAAWAALTALAVWHAADPGLSLAYVPLSLAGWIGFAITYAQDRPAQRRLLGLVLCVGAALGFLALLQRAVVVYGILPRLAPYIIEPRTQSYFAAHSLPEMTARYRASGSMFHPNSMGLYLGLLIPLIVSLWPCRALGIGRRLFLVGAAATTAGGLFATNSRAALVATLAALAVLGLHRGYRWLWPVAAVVFGLVLVAVAGSGRAEELSQRLAQAARLQYGLSGRPVIWSHVLEQIEEAPGLGVGPANLGPQTVAHYGFFIPNSPDEQMSQLWTLQNLRMEKVVENFHAHNIYLQLAGELGLAAPCLFAACLVWLGRRGETFAARLPAGSFRRAQCVMLPVWASFLAVYGLFDSQLAFTIDGINLVAGPLLAVALRSAS